VAGRNGALYFIFCNYVNHVLGVGVNIEDAGSR